MRLPETGSETGLQKHCMLGSRQMSACLICHIYFSLHNSDCPRAMICFYRCVIRPCVLWRTHRSNSPRRHRLQVGSKQPPLGSLRNAIVMCGVRLACPHGSAAPPATSALLKRATAPSNPAPKASKLCCC